MVASLLRFGVSVPGAIKGVDEGNPLDAVVVLRRREGADEGAGCVNEKLDITIAPRFGTFPVKCFDFGEFDVAENEGALLAEAPGCRGRGWARRQGRAAAEALVRPGCH